MNKIKKIASISDKIIQILFWLMTAGCILATIATVIILFLNPSYDAVTLSVGFLKFSLTEHTFYQIPIALYLAALVVLWIAFALALYIMKQLHNILQPMANGTPFDCRVSRNIRRIAFALLVSGFVCSLVQAGFINLLWYRALDMGNLFLNDSIGTCSLSLSFDFKFVLGFVLLLLLSYVFQYGEELQQLSDETL